MVDIKEIPRLLDVGQCNDEYSSVKIAVALTKAFDTDVNGLPQRLALWVYWVEFADVVWLQWRKQRKQRQYWRYGY